ncbi:protein kinase domain-containing protein [Actinoplanes sp. HUAS TT8]|uniref:protein kinase domain-containing protein n=1 Tax=Actinoplanes sp. HUAS TT8 TaxID=3447453 RepID=UPI003F525F10
MADRTSRLIAGRYRLVRLLGSGGMGRVWAARDELLDRDVAVKEILAPRGISAEDMDALCERTLREARATARLAHPNVVRVIDVVPDDGLPCIVMELVPSRSLFDAIRADGPMPPEQVARIGLDLLSALRAAHREGLLHRDVKPANVLLGYDGRTILTDFGLVSIAGESGLTATGVVLGSPSYLAPELALDGAATSASDLWSLGATLYTAVEGQPPYSRSTPAATLAALATEPPRPPKRAGVLRDALDGLLRRDPRQRIDADSAEHLLRIATGEVAAVPASHEARPRRGRVLAGVAVVAVLLVAAAVALTSIDPASEGGDSAVAATSSPKPAPSVTSVKRSTPAAAPATTAGTRTFTVVYLQSLVNDRWVTADDEGTSPLIAFPEVAGAWETWDEIDLGNGDIALRAEINDKYVTATADGTEPLIASRDRIGRTETFHLVENADGTVSLLARANGKYVSAARDGARPLINDKRAIGESEKFNRVTG